jgi:hypothetical protein
MVFDRERGREGSQGERPAPALDPGSSSHTPEIRQDRQEIEEPAQHVPAGAGPGDGLGAQRMQAQTSAAMVAPAATVELVVAALDPIASGRRATSQSTATLAECSRRLPR